MLGHPVWTGTPFQQRGVVVSRRSTGLQRGAELSLTVSEHIEGLRNWAHSPLSLVCAAKPGTTENSHHNGVAAAVSSSHSSLSLSFVDGHHYREGAGFHGPQTILWTVK